VKAINNLRIPRTYMGLAVALVGGSLGCTGVVDADGPAPGGMNAGTAGTGTGTGGSPGGMKPGNELEGCEGWTVAMPKRLIRLSFNQIATSLVPIFGQEFATMVATEKGIKDATERTFPPLGDTDEGSTYIDAKWQSADAIAKAAADYATANFATFTGCGATPTTECAQGFLGTLAQSAFRRPLTDREKSSLLTVYSEVVAKGGSIQEGTSYTVHAIFTSPHFLYRTEFGSSPAEGPIAPYELASQLSYFVTDGPPDAELLAAAAAGKLTTAEEIGPHIDRMLASPTVKTNLESTIVAALGISRVLSVVIDPQKVPEFNAGVAASMLRESQLFIKNTLWTSGSTVSDLVTSRKSYINSQLAPLYGVPAPTTLDADGFGAVDLPENRAGLLTSLGFLASRSRPDAQSVVGRGLAVNDAILCQINPAFPEALAEQIKTLDMAQEDLSERERADYRGTTPPCSGCHVGFDPFGIALENYDTIGRFRTVDDKMRPINASVTLPASAGGAMVQNAVEMGKALADTGGFAGCAASKLLTYALAETGVSGVSCATKAVLDKFKTTDQSFASLVKEVAISKTITQRTGG
jgi:hypothetical protein